VTREMRLSRQPHSDQLALWESIDRKSAAFQTRSPTRAASDIFDRSGLDLELMVTAVPVREDQIGAGFFINGKFKGIELFGEPKVFSKYIHKLIRSYGLDAIDPSAPRAGSTVDSESAKKKQGHYSTSYNLSVGPHTRLSDLVRIFAYRKTSSTVPHWSATSN